MSDAIRALREAVEAGEWHDGPALEPYPYWGEQAFNGSLYAALALMQAVLPGWTWGVNQNVWHRHFFAHVNKADGEEILHDFGAKADTPARALLLAILKALEARPEIGKPSVHLGNQPAGDSQ